ncbi:MAG: hypothetical protein ISR58_12535 [Anaerolineales bacterium]|nr:hypothetical protein [Chloroflexota bacterium]MBL6982006.1 hypothetical protein [Anaerolineales bacterium]
MSQDTQIILANMVMALAAIGSLIATVILTHRSLRDQRELQAKVVNNESLLLAREMLNHLPKALRFDGVTEEDFAELSQKGISEKEVAYLYVNFKAGAQLHEIAQRKIVTPYKPGDYRYTMMSVPETRVAWRILQKTISTSGFKDRMNATVQLFDEAS